jgi:hypothetical protein
MRARAPQLFAATAATGVVLGGAVSLLAFFLARYGPNGDGWSFKGNGALAAYPVFAAVPAAGWTALALLSRGSRHWLRGGAGAGLVGVLIAAVGAALLPVFGETADRIGSPTALLALVVWMVAAPIYASRLPVREEEVRSAVVYIAAGVVWFLGAAAGLAGVGVLIPAGS